MNSQIDFLDNLFAKIPQKQKKKKVKQDNSHKSLLPSFQEAISHKTLFQNDMYE